MTEFQMKKLLEQGAALEQFLFIIYYTNPMNDTVKLIADDGAIKMTLKRDRFVFLLNELLQPRTMEMEKNFQRIKASLNSYGKWYYFDRTQNIFKELGELPQKEQLKMLQPEVNKDKFTSLVNEYTSKMNYVTKRFIW